MEAVSLTPEDQAILELESSTVAGHTAKVILLGGQAPPDVRSLRARVAGRLNSVPALTRRLAGEPGEWAWVPDHGFDIASHVVFVDEPVDRTGLREVAARLFAERLDRDRPLWRIDVVPRQGGGVALIWRVHHALADGTTLMRYARALLWDAQIPAAEPHHVAHDEARRRAHLAGYVRREFALTHERSPFDAQIGTRREIAFASARLEDLHRAAKALCGGTVNDAVLAAVAGGLRHWLQLHHGHLGVVRVKVPVSLHHEGDDAANRDSFFTVGLPLNEPDPVARLRETATATSVRKNDHDAEVTDALLRTLAQVSPTLERWCTRITQTPRSFAVVVSNVPGPRNPVTVLGAPVDSLYSVAEIGERHALRVAVVSLAGTLFFSICADPAIVHNVQTMAQAIEDECRALSAAAECG